MIVFTHDDRLPEAVRRLQLPATVWEVARREHSIVELKKNDDPVSRYLDDARALACTKDISEEARGVVIAGFCRSAVRGSVPGGGAGPAAGRWRPARGRRARPD